MIDVIIPCYNCHATLARSLSSIAMQTVIKDVTVTLVNDCSESDYHEFVEAFSKIINIQEIEMEKNGGPGAARQAGLNETEGDFVVFVDADDTLATAFALEQMADAMIKHNMDVVSGQFQEEMQNGKFVTHGEQMVWVFGKMYRRSFLDRFLIRFNDTRANEDSGFNAVVSALTDRIMHIPQTVYMWHWSTNTITRSNNCEYTYAHGHRGYIDNMIWAAHELEKRALNKEIIRNFVVTVMCRLYFMHESVKYSAPSEAEASMALIRKFHKECYAPIDEYIPAPYLHDVYGKEQKRAISSADYIPQVTFRDFLKEAKGE